MSSIPGVSISKYEFAIAQFGEAVFSLPVDGFENTTQDAILPTNDPDIKIFRRPPRATGSLPEFPNLPWPKYLRPSTKCASVRELNIIVPSKDPFSHDDDAFMCLFGQHYQLPRAAAESRSRFQVNENIVFEYQMYTRLRPELFIPGPLLSD